ncbi:MAG: arginine--tRNA ligase [Alphaproteobacteria bacterium]|nr:arginine--tRNA ligase [Alphaproteobacteria bacterium]
MSSLSQNLSKIFGEAFTALGLPAALGAVRVSDRPDLAQFQCNGAMSAAKQAGKNPRAVAQDVLDALEGHAAFSKLEIAGPGFINIILDDAYIAAHLQVLGADEQFGVAPEGAGQKIVLDYGGPNIAKAMHVGHLRSSIIGDCLRRIYTFAGYDTIGDVHMGDWGTPMGMILSELTLMGHTGPVTMELLAEIYPRASASCKEDEARMALARAATKALQDGDPEATARWREFIEVSIAGMKANFDALGVHFDEWKGESDAHPFIESMITDYKARALAVESDGALVVNVAEPGDKKEIPPLILLKSDGAVLYGTTDLATIIDRIQAHNPVKIIYCVDQRQFLHFEQVFRAARKGGMVRDGRPELVFAGFGTMNGTDGKPFKTRAGGVMRLEDLIAMGLEKARARLEEADIAADLAPEEREDIAQKVAIAAIKFADLQNPRHSDYIFDLDRMISFEGKTGPYLLYQAVRIKSLLRKAGLGDIAAAPLKQSILILDDVVRPLALLLAEFPDHFQLALENFTPHVLCEYVYRLAQAFSSFYGSCHILSEPDEAVRAVRLALCAMTYRQIEAVMALIGVQIPERM